VKVVGFCGASGAGKTTLIEGVIQALKAAGQRVSVIKHAHKRFDIDREGKDSWRHREAGAFEVLIASRHLLAKVRKFEAETELGLDALLAELSEVDWVLVEGFKHGALPKVEVWRQALGQPPLYPHDAQVFAVVTDEPDGLPVPPQRPVLLWSDAAGLAALLLQSGSDHEYDPQRH
jgi:molybdopterin-guanine dinucleotide biosynthesis adapter protein